MCICSYNINKKKSKIFDIVEIADQAKLDYYDNSSRGDS